MIEKRIERPAIRRNNFVYQKEVHHQPNFDYRNFFDFGFFSNAAAHYGGSGGNFPNSRSVYVEKQIAPNNVIFEKYTSGPVHSSQFEHDDDEVD